jgi:hypothetical protein
MLLRQKAQIYAASLGISLEQFIVSAVAEKVDILTEHLDNPVFKVNKPNHNLFVNLVDV